MTTHKTRQAPGVTRLEREQGQKRGGSAHAAIHTAPAPGFLSPDQEQALFVELKRRGVVRPKAGFGDVRPFLEAYKQACREAGLL